MIQKRSIKNAMKWAMYLLHFVTITTVCGQSTTINYLSGTDKDHTIDWDFMVSSGANSGTWSKIPVPSNWETKGFGTYHYGWQEDFEKNEIGYYKHTFVSDAHWKNKTIKLVFEGSMTDTEVKVNGKSAGPMHQGSFYRFKYDITKLLKSSGENLLEVMVRKISSDTSVNRAERMSDFWVFGGIFRPVYLEIVPESHIEWTAIDAKADGSFLINVYTEGDQKNQTVEAQIKTLDGEKVGAPFRMPLEKDAEKTSLRTQVESPDLWSPEFPNRYQVELKLLDAKQNVVHTKTEKFGFRTVELKRGVGFFVNDVKVMFKGVNRHSAWPTSGRTMSKEISIMDVNLMKDMNMNAVRMSHYPPDGHFLDVCDSLGLFVIDELTGWQKKYDTAVGRKLLKEMVTKDVNHPSIVIWANGNEGGNNHELVEDYAKYDPQNRVVIHPWNIFNGTDTQHYKGYDCCDGSLYNGKEVFFPTEFLHGLFDGGHGAGLNDHWNKMMANPLSAGGFLWVFADEGVVRLDQGGRIDADGNHAPDGILGPYREKEGSFYTIKEIWSPVYIDHEKLPTHFDGDLEIENRYLYTNLNTVQFAWKLSTFPSPYAQDTIETVLDEGSIAGPDLQPKQRGKMKIPLDQQKKEMADLLTLKATDVHGRELYSWTWPLKSVKTINEQWINEPRPQAKAQVMETERDVTLTAGGLAISFDKSSGLIRQVKSGDEQIPFSNGPQPAVGKADFVSMEHATKGDSVFVEIHYNGPLKRVKYKLAPSGLLTLDYAYYHDTGDAGNAFDYLGINFDFPEELVTGVKYMGRGPYRVWKNRMKGNHYGVWHKKYNNTVTGESWEYPEFKGYYRNFNWVVIENTIKPFVIYSESDDLFLRLYTPPGPQAAENDHNSPPFPAGDISFLNGISAIGTKFDAATNHGPEGQPNKIGPEWIAGKLVFDFVGKYP
ncbi:glycoside hydrolase family 2 TIM barrel-domain containing protein [Sphingobacterium micropteri]|nr:glycoside hydrolase family 2 TIM barrel-domain containing protein [Sphingobacterium micropteri]